MNLPNPVAAEPRIEEEERPPSLRVAPDPVPDPAPTVEDGLDEVRQLLLGPDHAEQASFRQRVESPEWFAERLEPALPPAVRRSPDAFSDALYPVLGPAIRKAITSTLQATLERVNQTVEHSFSLEGLQLRAEARRTGVSFGELVLRKSLIYRVEQVFMIHRETGLLLQHVVDPGIAAPDPEQVAAMLTAIKDFAQDSFGVDDRQALDEVHVGGVTLLVETGPEAVLAAVVRGNPPEDLRVLLQETLETLHRGDIGDALVEFDGDDSAFVAARPDLESCLAVELKPRRGGIPRQVRFFWGAVALAGLWLLGTSLQTSWRWRSFRQLARQDPGLIITSVDRGWFGNALVTGFKDPVASDPRALATRVGLDPAGIDFQLNRFYSMDEAMVLTRARRILSPPGSVRIEFYAGELRIRGQASVEWQQLARERALYIPGIQGIQMLVQPLSVSGP